MGYKNWLKQQTKLDGGSSLYFCLCLPEKNEEQPISTISDSFNWKICIKLFYIIKNIYIKRLLKFV